MNPPYSIEDLIDDRNRALYTELTAKSKITLTASDDSGWGCKAQERTIFFSKSAYPISCFTHELLHLKFESEGMECPLFVAEESDMIKELVAFFHNQLVHHKIFPVFVKLGFPAGEFLNDDDNAEMPKRLSRDIKKLEKLFEKGKVAIGGASIAMPYLSINSPHESGGRFRDFEARLRRISAPATIQTVDRILQEWMANENPNCSRPLAQLFNVCGICQIGFTLTGLPNDTVYAMDM